MSNTDSAFALARSSVRMMRSRIAHDERLIRAYLLEIEELRRMIEQLEHEILRSDVHTDIQRNNMLSPPALRRQAN